MIKENLENVRKRIESACLRSGNDPKEIILVAVSKTFPVSSNLDAIEAGQFHFGENKLQELVRKRAYLTLNGNDEPVWHMIGHLQSNKAKLTVQNVDFFHCLDSTKLADKLNKYCIAENRKLNVLVQINSSGEESKAGIDPSELAGLLKHLKYLDGLNVCGLMSIGTFNADQEDSRDEFKFMKKLFDTSKKDHPHFDMKYLSMGMSNDFEVAIEEGANIIRVGTSIFGVRGK